MAMWTEAHRRIYRREGDECPSDPRDAEWARLRPLIPEASLRGRPRKTDMRAATNAILYLLRSGCPWRYQPPRRPFHYFRLPTNIFRKFQCDGVWRMRSGPSCNGVASGWAERPAPRLRFSTTNRSTRQKNGRQRQPGRLRRRQAGEGPQDTPWSIAKGCRCGSSSTPPRSRTATGLDKIRRRFAWLGLIWADGGYNAWQVDAAVAKVPPLRTEIVKRSDDTRSFVVLPRR
jgi:transposase